MSFRGTFNQKRNTYRLSCSRNLRLESLEQRNLLSVNTWSTENTEEDAVPALFSADTLDNSPAEKQNIADSLTTPTGKGKLLKEQFIIVDTADDTTDAADGKTSLREAIVLAKQTGKKILLAEGIGKIEIANSELANSMKEVTILASENSIDFSKLQESNPEFETPTVQNVIWVTAEDDAINDDDTTSLREAIELAEEGQTILFADEVDTITLTGMLTIDKGITISGEVTIDDGDNFYGFILTSESEMTISGVTLQGLFVDNDGMVELREVTFDGTTVENYESMTIADSLFTGDYEGVNVLVDNWGTLEITNSDFHEITMNWEVDSYYDSDFYFNGSSFIRNSNTLELQSVAFAQNEISATSEYQDNFLNFSAIANGLGVSLRADGLIITENHLTAKTDSGDLMAVFAGIWDNTFVESGVSNEITLYNALIYNNQATVEADELFADLVDSETHVYSLLTGISTFNIVNGTLLDEVYAERGSTQLVNVNVSNSILYIGNNLKEFEGKEGRFDGNGGYILPERGVVVDCGNNLFVKDLAELEEIFPAYDASTGIFTDYDYRMYLDSTIVNAGNNELVAGIEKDALGNDRINHGTVEIGAIESQAVALAAPEVSATYGENSLSEVVVTWQPVEGASGYQLHYKIGDSENWTTVSEEGMPSLGEGGYTFTVDGLAEGTSVTFEVMALGDNLDYYNSNWASATAKTQIQLATPEMEVTYLLISPQTADVSWLHVPNANGYTLEYRVKEEGTDWIPLSLGSSNYNELTNYNSYRDIVLELGTSYEFRLKANGSEEYKESGYATTTITTPSQLGDIALEPGKCTDDSLTVTWNGDSQTLDTFKGYTLRYKATDSDNWDSVSLGKTTSFTLNQLPEGVTYDFQIKVLGQDSVLDSDWSNTVTLTTMQQLATPVVSATATSPTTVTLTIETLIDGAAAYTVECFVKGSETPANVTIERDTEIPTQWNISGLTQDTFYVFTVVANPETGSEEFTPSDAGTAEERTWIQLSAPVVTLGERTTNSVSISWDAVPNSSGYEVQYKLSENGEWEDLGYNSETLTATFTEGVDIPETQAIWFKVRALGQANESANSVWSTVVDSGTLEQLLSVGLAATVTGTQTIEISWDKIDNAGGYTLIIQGEDSEPISQEVSADTLSHTFENLTPDTSYTITVVANGVEGASVSSKATTKTVKTWIQLQAPEWEIVKRTDTDISGTITPMENVTSFVVEYQKVGETTWETATLAGNIFTISDATPATQYNIRVMAEGITDTSVDSPWNTVTVATKGVLATPEPFVTLTGIRKVDVAWMPIDNAESYLLEYRIAETENWSQVVVTQTLSNSVTHLLENLESSKTYEIRVTALAAADGEFVDSLASDTKTVTTKEATALPTPTLDGTVNGSESITLNWESVENAVSYTVFVVNENGEPTEVWTGTETTYTYETQPGTTVNFQVVANADPEQEFFTNSTAATLAETTEKAQLAAPQITFTYDNVADGIVVNWNAIENASGYLLEWKTGDGDWETVSEEVGTSWSSKEELKGVYTFRVTALGDDVSYTDSLPSAEASITTDVNLVGVIRREPSPEGTTSIPESEEWVDEWMDVYLEIWSEDLSGLIPGRSLTILIEAVDGVNGGYTVKTDYFLEGIFAEILENGSGTLTATQGFQNPEGVTLVGRLLLTPQNENLVDWNKTFVEDAFVFNQENLGTDIYAIPGDLDDNGIIDFDGGDNTEFDKEIGKTNSYANFDGLGEATLGDRAWMALVNDGKSFYGDKKVVYHENFVKIIRGELPVEKDENALSDNGKDNATETAQIRTRAIDAVLEEMMEEKLEALLA
ncbi:MAG: fibronectin type III domain-containing protein [Planctomycetia bacterium]|nr:fibronectin type III domain-containing protein [Planctomycetia bacterium]